MVSLRQRRQSLVEQVDLRGEAFCQAYTEEADAWLTRVFESATDSDTSGLALIAVGGYGRGELCPYSDLDVVLLHRGKRDVSGIADRIWYPVWDEGIPLDHSVRKPAEALDVAATDLRAALGLLDARLVCGDPRVATPLIDEARSRWEKQKPPWLESLADLVVERHAAHGDVAFLLEPDLKESHGGLRDIGSLVAMMQAVPRLADVVDSAAIADARETLTLVRVELHRQAGRELNKLLLQEQDAIAASLGIDDADALMGVVATAGRTVAWEGDDVWRRRSTWAVGRGGRRKAKAGRSERAGAAVAAEEVPGAPGVAVADGQVVLLPTADVTGDASLALRLAAVSAQRDLPISREALDLLVREAPEPATPWSDHLRQLFIGILALGQPAIGALETLDQRRLLVRYLPEWSAVRNKPQRNAYHRYTVDRHLLEATANAAALADRVARPDLLLIGTLLHDIGKGYPGDHTDVGMDLVRTIGTRMGFDEPDVDVLVSLIRLHLVLPDMATRRDLDDPATAQRIADEVGDRSTLELLAALVEADSQATGPSAWGTWKAGLMAELVERSARLLAGEVVQPFTSGILDDHRTAMDVVRASGVPSLTLDGPTLTVIAPDRPGLLSRVTGVLALHGLNVQAAKAAGEEGVAVEIFTVEPERGRWPEAARMATDLDAVLAGRLDLEARLADRAKVYRPVVRATTPQLVATRVTLDQDASATATVVEVRAADVVGQLHRITEALVSCGLDVLSARVSTYGAAVVDSFYVRGPDGQKLADPAVIADVERAVTDRVESAGEIGDAPVQVLP